MNDDEQLERIFTSIARGWRVPPRPPVDEIWTRVEAEAFPARRHLQRPGWWSVGIAAAASLTIGVALGRVTVLGDASTLKPPVVVTLPPPPQGGVTDSDPYSRTTNELLGRTALLLAALPQAGIDPEPTFVIASQGGELLTTTRLLLDSPVAREPEMRALLEDLELVLVQVARLRGPGSGDLVLIHDALDRREIVPRLRSAVIGSSLDLH